MEKVYIVCMIIGITIPLLTLILGGIGDVFHGISHGVSELFSSFDPNFDPSIEIGSVDVSLLPFSLHSICAGLLVFGASGKLIYDGTNTLAANLIGGGLAYLMAVVIQTMIRRLKKVEHTTYSQEELLLFDAKVIHTILKDSFGSVSITTFDGITTNYPAKSEQKGHSIKQGTIVRVVRFEGNTAYVSEKDELERKYSQSE